MRRRTIGLLLACALACLVGCGGKGLAPADTAPFQAAIDGYLKSKSMGMKVEGFESLDVKGDAATAVCRMTVADDLYGGLAVRWRFTFARKNDAWEATGHEQL